MIDKETEKQLERNYDEHCRMVKELAKLKDINDNLGNYCYVDESKCTSAVALENTVICYEANKLPNFMPLWLVVHDMIQKLERDILHNSSQSMLLAVGQQLS